MENWRDPKWADKMSLRLDFSHMMSDFIGADKGITREEIDGLIPRALEIAANIKNKREIDEWGLYELPYDIETAGKVLQVSGSFRDKCDDFVVLGIGGSALGGIALFHALCHPLHNLVSKSCRGGAPRIFFLDNVDPATFSSVLNFVDPERTVFNVVTKSGSTAETM